MIEERLRQAFDEAAALVDVEPPERRTTSFGAAAERRPSRWLMVAAAAAIVAGTLGVVTVVRHRGDDAPIATPASTTTTSVPLVPTTPQTDPAVVPAGPGPESVASPDLGSFTDIDDLVAALVDSGPLDNLTTRAVDAGVAPSRSICADLAERNDAAAGTVVHQATASFDGENAVVLVLMGTSTPPIAQASVYSTGTADPVTGGCRLLATAPITTMQVQPVEATQFDVDVGDLASGAPASLESVFFAGWDDPEWGLGLDRANEIYPAGLGVSEDGTIHLLDGVNRRVITVSADDARASRPIPDALVADRFVGIAVAADGTEYLITTEAVIVVRDGALIARSPTNEFASGGGSSARATPEGLWARDESRWRLVLGADGLAPTEPLERLPVSDPALGTSQSVQTIPGAPTVIRALYDDPVWRTFSITSNPVIDGFYVHTIVGDDVVLAGGSVNINAQFVIVLHPDGSSDSVRLDVESGGLLENDGVKLLVVGTALYIETAPVDSGVEVQRFDFAPLLTDR